MRYYSGQMKLALEILQDLPAIVTRTREARGMSQRELARQLEMSPSALSRFESGDTAMGRYKLMTILDWLSRQ